jgi:hypothetical protein
MHLPVAFASDPKTLDCGAGGVASAVPENSANYGWRGTLSDL